MFYYFIFTLSSHVVSKTEELLRQRVENLLEALDNVIRNSESRNKQSKELIEDLKKANRYLHLCIELGN